MDFRWQRFIPRALRESFDVRNPDFISLAGGAFHAARPEVTSGQEVIKEGIGLAVRSHGVRRIVLLNHTNCGKYAQVGHCFRDRDLELEFHSEQLRQAGAWVKGHFPSVDLLLGLMTFEGSRVRIMPVKD